MKKILFLHVPRKGAAGFTLIEALIALLILSFAILGIFSIHIQSVKTSAFNRRMLSAVQFARSGIDQFRSQRFSTLATSTDNSANAADFSGTDFHFLRVKTITNVPGISKLKKARVEVGWNNTGDCTGGSITGCANSIALESYIPDLDN
jgi:type II secretory pathway pseudopilin PulG